MWSGVSSLLHSILVAVYKLLEVRIAECCVPVVGELIVVPVVDVWVSKVIIFVFWKFIIIFIVIKFWYFEFFDFWDI